MCCHLGFNSFTLAFMLRKSKSRVAVEKLAIRCHPMKQW